MTATLSNIAQNRYRLLAHCHGCGHVEELDLGGLTETLGPMFPVPALRDRLRCSRCGVKGGDVQVALPAE